MGSGRLERVVVVGTSGSGKTTFARSLSIELGATYTEVDALYWGQNWTPRPQEEMSAGQPRLTAR